MGRLSSLVKDTAVYGVSSIVGRMLNWLLVPLYTQYLLPEKYGIVTELYAYVAFLVIIYTYGMETSFFRFSTKIQSEKDRIYNLAESSIILSSLLFSCFIILFSTSIANYLEYPGKEKYIIWFAIILGIDAILAIPFARLRLENKSKKFAAYKLLNIFANISLNLFFIVFCTYVVSEKENGFFYSIISKFYNKENLVDYIFISNLLANLFLFIIFLPEILRIRVQINRKELKRMYVYGFPIMIMSLAGVTNEMLSRVVLKKWLPEGFYPHLSNQAALGIFGAAYKLSIFMTMAIQAFRYAAEPFFFSRSNDADSKHLFAKVMYGYILFGTLILLVISLNLDVIGILFLRNESYREGLRIVPILLLANLLLGIYYNLSVWFKLTDKTYFGTLISILGAIITIVANYALIPLLGYTGSALSALICYGTMTIISYRLGVKYYPIPYMVGKSLLYIFIAIGFTYIGFYFFAGFSLVHKAIQTLLITLFVLIIYRFEKKTFLEIIHKIKKTL